MPGYEVIEVDEDLLKDWRMWCNIVDKAVIVTHVKPVWVLYDPTVYFMPKWYWGPDGDYK